QRQDSEPERSVPAGADGAGRQRPDEEGTGAAGEGADLAADGLRARGGSRARPEGAGAAEAEGDAPDGAAGRGGRSGPGPRDPQGHLVSAAEGGQGPEAADRRGPAAVPGGDVERVHEGRRSDAATGRGDEGARYSQRRGQIRT